MRFEPDVVIDAYHSLSDSGFIDDHGSIQIGRCEIDSNLGSDTSLGLVNEWLDDCLERHSNCSSDTIYHLPTRVIDVGDLDEVLCPRLLITNGLKGRYVVLGHC